MGRLMGKAQTDGLNAYYTSDGYRELVEYQQALAGEVGQSVADSGAWREIGYIMAQEMSKGMRAYTETPRVKGTWQWDSSDWNQSDTTNIPSYASGLERVPYDGYLARLHEGERVLTASQARELKNDTGRSGEVTINVETLQVREEADIQKIGKSLLEEIKKARRAGLY